MTRIQFRRGTEAAWAAANPVPLVGEPAYAFDTKVLKMGDGTTAWNALPAISDPALLAQATDLLDQFNNLEATTDGLMTSILNDPDSSFRALLESGFGGGGGGGGGAPGQVYVWNYESGAYPALPSVKPTGVERVEAAGPVQPTSVPSWIGLTPDKVPCFYVYSPLT